MKFLLLVCWDAEKMDAQTEPDPADTADEESFPWLDDLRARGIWVTGNQLAPPRRTRSVRVRDAKALVTDGPFAGRRVRHPRLRQPGGGRRDRGRTPRRPVGDDRGPAALGELTSAGRAFSAGGTDALGWAP
jgi:hypothetical protein